MNLAQMETFQYLLDSIQGIPKLPNYDLLFSLNGKLCTADFYKHSTFPMNRASYYKEIKRDDGFIYFDKQTPGNDFLITKAANKFETPEFHNTYMGMLNLQYPEIIFRIFERFILSLEDGKPTSEFIYGLKSIDGTLDLPFYAVSSDDKLSPVSLVESKDSEN